MSWRGTEVFRKDRICGGNRWLCDNLWMYSILKGADGLLLKNIAGEKEKCGEYEDCDMSIFINRLRSNPGNSLPMPDDIATEICELVTSILKVYAATSAMADFRASPRSLFYMADCLHAWLAG